MSDVGMTGVDCHAHVIDPARFAFVAGRGYQPRPDESGPREAYWRTLESHGMSGGVIVQPSCYAFDNRALVDAMAMRPGRAVGIAVVANDIGDDALDMLAAAGCVGVRLNFGSFDPDFFDAPGADAFLRRMRDRSLAVQVYAASQVWARIAPRLADSGARIVVDHMGEPDPVAGVSQHGFQAMLTLGRTDRACVKLSAPYRGSHLAAPYDDMVPFARACLEGFGEDRCVWGSDWPFLNASRPTSYADQLAWLRRVVPDEALRRRILVDNPESLFGFAHRDPKRTARKEAQ